MRKFIGNFPLVLRRNFPYGAIARKSRPAFHVGENESDRVDDRSIMARSPYRRDQSTFFTSDRAAMCIRFTVLGLFR